MVRYSCKRDEIGQVFIVGEDGHVLEQARLQQEGESDEQLRGAGYVLALERFPMLNAGDVSPDDVENSLWVWISR